MNGVDPFGLFEDGKSHGGKYLGHGDFYGSSLFDFTLEDHGLTSPLVQPWLHFQPVSQSLDEVYDAYVACEAEDFARAMHRLQDYFSHYSKGYRWDPFNENLPCDGWGHLCDINDDLNNPDHDMLAWGMANKVTMDWVDRYIATCGCPK